MSLDPISAALDLGGEILKRVVPDPAQRATAQLALESLHQTGELAQITAAVDLAKGQLAVNQTEAADESLFKSGWRPFMGWVCGAAFTMNYIGAPLLTWMGQLFGGNVAFPTFDAGVIMPVLVGMLGLSASRSYDKLKGTTP